MNLVNELQLSAERDDVLTVLRKTRRLASKLGRRDIGDWLNAEQNGYRPNQDIPDYRMISATLAYDTNGYIPAGYGFVMKGIVDIPDHGLDLPLPFRDSISNVLSLIEGLKGERGVYHPAEDGSEMSRSLRSYFRVAPEFAQQISFLSRLNPVQIKAIPERIKDKVLEWACDLEAAGVTGDGLSFSPEEKKIAHSITFNIHNSTIDQLNNMGMNQRGGQ